MIDVYVGPTPNGRIPLLALEETGEPYRLHKVALFEGAQYQAEFLAKNPAAQIPVIVDDAADGGSSVTLSQTTAILLYLAEKTSQLLPPSPADRARAFEALALHATDLAPSFYLAYHLERLLGTDDAAVRDRLRMRGWKYYVVLDGWLKERPYLGGDDCSIADLAAFPWAEMMDRESLAKLEGLAAWRERLSERPAVQRAMALDIGPPLGSRAS